MVQNFDLQKTTISTAYDPGRSFKYRWNLCLHGTS